MQNVNTGFCVSTSEVVRSVLVNQVVLVANGLSGERQGLFYFWGGRGCWNQDHESAVSLVIRISELRLRHSAPKRDRMFRRGSYTTEDGYLGGSGEGRRREQSQ